MNVRTPVFVYADDPVSQAGLEQLLRADAGDLRGRRPTRSTTPRWPWSASTRSTTTPCGRSPACSATGARGSSSSPPSSTSTAVLAASEAGTLGHAAADRDATAERLGRVVRQVAAGEASVPTDLVGAAARRRAPHPARRRDHRVAAPATLSPREQDVIRLLAEGRDTAEIASTLCYSERTVKGVIHEVTSRLQLRNRSHVVAFALRNDML